MKSNYVRRTRGKFNSHGTFFRQSTAPSPFFGAAEPLVQKKCEACCQKEERSPAFQSSAYIQRLPHHGEPMSASVRTFFEARMGSDFSSVRIHRDAEAAQSASALRAQAYTVGNDIVFNRDKYSPETSEGRKLLSHELIHVVQQRSTAGNTVQMAPETDQASEKKEPAEAKEKEQAAEVESEKLSEPMQLPDFSTFGKPTKHTDFGNSVTFNGRTDATFDGGVGQTKNLKAVPGKECEGCAAGECVQVTGSLVINYHASTTVTLPDVPSGLTPCQEKRVSEAINNKIKPHEDQHVAAFSTYNGSVTLPINYNGCKAGLSQHVQSMHDAHAVAREDAARAKSAALDPFNVHVDLDCEDEPPKK